MGMVPMATGRFNVRLLAIREVALDETNITSCSSQCTT
jgi:hypothetical protein